MNVQRSQLSILIGKLRFYLEVLADFQEERQGGKAMGPAAILLDHVYVLMDLYATSSGFNSRLDFSKSLTFSLLETSCNPKTTEYATLELARRFFEKRGACRRQEMTSQYTFP